MAKSDNHWLGWINRRDQRQVEWACEYLRRRGIPVGGSYDPYLELRSVSNPWGDSADGREFVRKMKAAWSQKKYRDKRDGNKSVSFVISKEARKRLRRSAKQAGIKMNKMLERLIEESDVSGGGESGGSEARTDTCSWDASGHGEGGQVRSLFSNAVVDVADARLREICRYQVLLWDAGISSSGLTESQKSRAERMYREITAPVEDPDDNQSLI